MTDQLDLFTTTPTDAPWQPAPSTTTPSAAMCALCETRPVRWNRAQQTYGRYCSGAHCANPVRPCKECGTPFAINTNGAGSKYCSNRCKHIGYTKHYRSPDDVQVIVRCAMCDQDTRTRPGQRALICSRCQVRYAQTIRVHRLDTQWAIRLITATTCDCCGDRLPRHQGRHKGVLDHDHTCCPHERSCGECVRGIICHHCNTLAGHVERHAERLDHIVRYLRPT